MGTNSKAHFSRGFATMETLQMTKSPKSSRTTCGPTPFSISLFLTLKSKTKTMMTWKTKRRSVSRLSYLKRKRKTPKRLTKGRRKMMLVETRRLKTQVLAQLQLGNGIREYDYDGVYAALPKNCLIFK